MTLQFLGHSDHWACLSGYQEQRDAIGICIFKSRKYTIIVFICCSDSDFWNLLQQ